ncbi:MAG: bifunctional 5,10-methylenetetrahydrofolate dehydrogenase/5,10-methenyltetrahydrofolate cyclohydrolase [Oscillospiraceae bacterium]|jgi:methylenetetrahydrofolate dehydrogenase (NADP+)/methenyltetrahydrofolate cyclohydrolase|nr:bifunctional 5,10-methylenetetrahydrofolate dehydrogenase/5,10-methenyltetrahydrofolate cyclohydrolase [Oscillospiraceae bacterium]
MAKLLEGRLVVAALKEKQQAAVARLKEKGVSPTLGIIRVGERGDDIAYEKGAIKRCESVGVSVRVMALPQGATQAELIELIESVNKDVSIHGVLLFRPLPKHMDDETVRGALSPQKDVDGIGDGSLAGVFTGADKGFAPCTAQACMEILDHFGYDPRGKRVTVIGRSLVVGKPVAMMLLAKHATVTICHTRTADMPKACRDAEILIVAAGRAGVVGKEFFSPGQVVIDVGINFTEDGKMCGDADFEAAEPVVGAITPVPGGVGTVTTSVLVGNVITAAERMAGCGQ